MPLTEDVREAIVEAIAQLFGPEGPYSPMTRRECDVRHGYLNVALKLVFSGLLLIAVGVAVALLTGVGGIG